MASILVVVDPSKSFIVEMDVSVTVQLLLDGHPVGIIMLTNENYLQLLTLSRSGGTTCMVLNLMFSLIKRASSVSQLKRT